MIYSRCLYLILLKADDRARATYPVTRGAVSEQLCHSCRMLACDMIALGIGNGFVLLLADLNVFTSIKTFITRIRSCLPDSSNIKTPSAEDEPLPYWSACSYFRTISPEDKENASTFVASLTISDNAENLALRCHMHKIDVDKLDESQQALHHIIIITSRSRMLLKEKYRDLLAEMTCDAAKEIGAEPVCAGAMCNHIHLLAFLPTDVCVSDFIRDLEARLIEKMHANRHFRSFDGWDEHSLVFTVSEKRKPEELRSVMLQVSIHRRLDWGNEMTYLYKKMTIPYVTSLR